MLTLARHCHRDRPCYDRGVVTSQNIPYHTPDFAFFFLLDVISSPFRNVKACYETHL